LAVEEAEKPLDAYQSVLDLFTRRLKPGVRPIDTDLEALVSPVDGAFLVGGPVGNGQLFQAKGRDFTVGALLADPQAATVFGKGTYCTVYLAPRDYHRIHAPEGGLITGYTYVPGELYPVNQAAVTHVDGLFARNERLITHLATEKFGRIDVVKVGATNVGHISLVYDPTVRTNVGATEIVRHTYAQPIPVARGAELGVFEMGSTVILVMERAVQLDPMAPGTPVRLGRPIGHL